MKFSFHSTEISSDTSDMVALGAFQDQLHGTPIFLELDRALGGLLSSLAEAEDFKAKAEQLLHVNTLDRLPCARILLVGLGKREDFQLADGRVMGALAAREATRRGCRSLLLTPPPVDLSALEQSLQFLVEGVLLGRYRFERYRSKDAQTRDLLQSVALHMPAERSNGDTAGSPGLAVARGEVVADAVCWARDLVNEPAAVMTPTRLADLALGICKDSDTLTCKVLGPKECDKQKLRLLLAVSQGSAEEPRFVHLTYRPKGREKPKRRFVLVGKGVTFDAGGLSLKPTSSMLDMKTDMAGAATVLAVARALPLLGIQSEVHVLVPATENMISGAAYRIGDIITGLGGKSVEIVNTDAEGRLILADALAYGVKLAPDEMIDVATLTGACVVALGPHVAGAMGNDRALVERFLATARRVGEEVWPLPLPQRLAEQLKSNLADLKNAGDRWGGALTAGLFLKEFAGKVNWLHLDIAGPSSAEKEWGHIVKGGTGFGVVSLLEYLRNRDDAP